MQRYTFSVAFGELPQEAKDGVLEEVGKRAKILFKEYFETIKFGVGLPKLEPEARLAAYRQRTPDMWARLQANFYKEYERQVKDWGNLENKARQPSRQIMQSAQAKVTAFEPSERAGA